MPRAPYEPFDESVYRPVIHSIPLRGVAPDLPAEELGNDYLTSAKNFLVRNGRVQKREGYDTTYPPGMVTAIGGTVMGMFEFISTRATTSAVVVLGTTTTFRMLTPGATDWVNVTGSAQSGSLANPVFFCTIMTASVGQRVVSVNGVNPPQVWVGSATANFGVLTTAVIGACVVPWKNHLLQGDTTDTADGHIITRVHWSALGDPATWFGTASAGSIDLTEANASRIQNFVPMRTVLAVYKEEGVHAISYRASPLYFTQSILHPTISAISRRAIAGVQNGERHFVFTKDGVILWDGQSIKPIGRNRVDRTLLRSLNWDARESIWAKWWGANEEIVLGIPTGTATSPNTVWVYNLTYDAWWEQNLSFRNVEPVYFQGSVPLLLAGSGTDAGLVYRAFNGNTDDPFSLRGISASLQLGMFDYGALEHKQVYKMTVIAGAMGISTTLPGGATIDSSIKIKLNITKANQETPLATPFYDPDFSQVLEVEPLTGNELPHVDFMLTDRWISYRVDMTASGSICTIKALIPHLVERTGRDKKKAGDT